MKIILSALLVISFCNYSFSQIDLNQRNQPDSTFFECTISSEKTSYQIGEIPKIEIKIRNKTSDEVLFLGCLDGSEVKWRMPYCYYTIESPKKQKIEFSPRCGNMNTLRPNDFVLTKSNEVFNPYQQIDDYGFFDSFIINNPNTFNAAGIYKVQFYYNSNSTNIKDFMGDYNTKADIEKLSKLFEKIRKIELSSNILEIEFSKD